tara:strand:- start:174 stop:335 length:162 start_codon:yes stop_codon:yes gene_type:complete
LGANGVRDLDFGDRELGVETGELVEIFERRGVDTGVSISSRPALGVGSFPEGE